MLPPMIGISGLPNAGKDTTADYLIREYGYKKLSLASPIRELLYTTFALDKGRMGERAYESIPLPQLGGNTIKVALQLLGKACTDIYDHIWVNATFKGLDLTQRWVIADVRRPCEMQKIKEVGGICMYIHSDRPLPNDGRDMNHESESYHDYLRAGADYHLHNDYQSVIGYYLHIDTLMKAISLKAFITNTQEGL